MASLIYFNASSNPNPPKIDLENYFSPYQYLLSSLKEQGMDLYEPLDVAGYDAYSQEPYYNRNWISANYLAYRYKFPQYLLNAKETDSYYSFFIDVMEFIQQPGQVSDPSNATVLVQELIDNLLPEPITAARFDYFKNIFLDQFGDIQWQMEWNKYLANGDSTVVKKQLEILIWTLLKSPEYQFKLKISFPGINSHSMKRRDFIKGISAVSAPFIFNGIPINVMGKDSVLARLAADSTNDKVLILVQLHGGNDGLNTLIPISQYNLMLILRPNIKIPDKDNRKYIELDKTLPEAQRIGLHPDMGSMKSLYDAGKLAIIQKCRIPRF